MNTWPRLKYRLYFFICFFHTAGACKIYFLCNTGDAGLGDQLEHYVYCSYCAKLLKANIALNGFQGGPSHHQGSAEYRDAARLLGINTAVNKTAVESLHLNKVELSFHDVLDLHKAFRNGSRTNPCDTLYISDIYSCPAVNWCDFLPTYDSLKAVSWKLRRTHARQKCFASRLGFNASSAAVNVIWHVRVGDICLRCNNSQYFTDLYSRLLTASPTLSASHQLVFESQGRVEFLEKTFQDAVYYHNSTLVETDCRFLTADVLITSGSSFPPFIAAFAPPWSPIVLEERRKELSETSTSAHHFFTPEEAVLLEDGRPLLSEDEFSAVLESVLVEKLSKRRGPCGA